MFVEVEELFYGLRQKEVYVGMDPREAQGSVLQMC